MFEPFDVRVTQAPYECEHGISERGEYLRRISGVRAGLVFAAGHVAYVAQAVLDAPVRAGQRQKFLRTGVRLAIA